MQNILEGIAIKWCYLINDVLIDTSEKLFSKNAHPTPAAEYLFWNNRFTNLENLYTQLTENNRHVVGCILEQISSIYFTAFRQAFQNTVMALTQARDVKIHLNALAPHTHVFQTISFHESRPLIKPLLHCMCLMWSKSKYYPTINWVLLFKMIGNMMIEESTKNLDPDTLFQNDSTEDSLIKIAETISNLESYK